jgi:hypothetical protein
MEVCDTRSSLLFSSLGAAALFALSASPAFSECTCRYKGGETADGQTVCMMTPKGRQLALCEKVLNVTSWKFLGQPCPTAANDGQPISIPPAQSYSAG